jgi:hypothetical protein
VAANALFHRPALFVERHGEPSQPCGPKILVIGALNGESGVRCPAQPSLRGVGSIGPYPYRHISLVERPGHGMGMHAEAGMTGEY